MIQDVPRNAATRHQVAQLYLKLSWSTPPPPACEAIPRCDRCGILPRPWAFIVLTYLPSDGWLCDPCLSAQAPPGAAIAPVPLS